MLVFEPLAVFPLAILMNREAFSVTHVIKELAFIRLTFRVRKLSVAAGIAKIPGSYIR